MQPSSRDPRRQSWAKSDRQWVASSSALTSVVEYETIEVRLSTDVKQKANLERGGAQVVVQLPAGILVEPLGRLDFDDDLVVDYHVESLSADGDAVLPDDDLDLATDAVPAGG